MLVRAELGAMCSRLVLSISYLLCNWLAALAADANTHRQVLSVGAHFLPWRYCLFSVMYEVDQAHYKLPLQKQTLIVQPGFWMVQPDGHVK